MLGWLEVWGRVVECRGEGCGRSEEEERAREKKKEGKTESGGRWVL